MPFLKGNLPMRVSLEDAASVAVNMTIISFGFTHQYTPKEEGIEMIAKSSRSR